MEVPFTQVLRQLAMLLEHVCLTHAYVIVYQRVVKNHRGDCGEYVVQEAQHCTVKEKLSLVQHLDILQELLVELFRD